MSQTERSLKRAPSGDNSAPPAKQGRSVSDQNKPTAPTRCAACTTYLQDDITAQCFMNCPENCILCLLCHSSAITAKVCAREMVCPGCNSTVRSWTLRCNETLLLRSGELNAKIVERNYELPAPDPEKDPMRYFEAYENHESFARLAMTGVDPINDCINTVSCVLNTSNCNEWSEEQMRAVETLGMNLHAMLITGDEAGKNVRYDPLAYPSSDALTDLAYQDNSALHRFIHALSNGDRLEYASRKNKAHEKVVKTTFGAKETIRCLRSQTPGALKDIMGAQMAAHNVPSSVFEILNEYGIAPGKSVVVKKDKGVVQMKLTQGLENITQDRYALVITYYDNLGFKQRRAVRVGYKQYTKIIHVVISREELMQLGIYPDPSAPGRRLLSNTRKKWEDERKNPSNGFDTVCAPNDGDYNCLAETVLLSIDSLLKLVADGKLPSLEEAKRMLESCNVDWPDTIPDNYGARKVVEDESQAPQIYVPSSRPYDSDSDSDDEDEADSKPAARPTSFGVNKATMDVPMEMDLNDRKTVIRLADYELEFREKLLEIGVKDGDPLADVIPIMDYFGITLAGDGAPSYLLTRIKRENPAAYLGLLNIRFGGFHTGLNGWKANGKLFAPALLDDVISLWRFSEKQRKWVMDPGDPNQIEDEMTMMVIAEYVAAIHGLIELRQQRGETDVDIKSTDVVDHMISRAKEHKVAMAALIQLRLVECLFLLMDSESNRDDEKYRTALKFLTIFFCSSHSPKYVSLGSDFFADWFCGSEVDKALFKEILFRKTINGHSIFGDRFVEWTMRDLRYFLGDFSTGDAHNSYVYRISLLLDNKKILKNVMKTEDKGTKTNEQRHLRINKVFCESFVYFMESKIWGTGTPIQVPAKPWLDRMDMDHEQWEENGGTTPAGTAVINPGLCFVFSEGLKRWCEYFTKFLVEGDLNDPTRTETDRGVSLKLVDPTLEERDNREKLDLERIVSTNPDYLNTKGVYIMEELRKELRQLNDSLPNGVSKVRAASFRGDDDKSTKKKHYVLAIVQARKLFIERNRHWKQTRQQAMKEKHGQQRASEESAFKERVETELSSKLFGFNGCNAREKYSSEHRVVGAEEDTGFSSQQVNFSQASAHSAASESTAGFGTGALRMDVTPDMDRFKIN